MHKYYESIKGLWLLEGTEKKYRFYEKSFIVYLQDRQNSYDYFIEEKNGAVYMHIGSRKYLFGVVNPYAKTPYFVLIGSKFNTFLKIPESSAIADNP